MVDEVWAEWEFEPQCYLDAGPTVVVLAPLVAKGSASGVHLERDVAHLWTFEHGRAARIQVYLDQAEALEVAGITE